MDYPEPRNAGLGKVALVLAQAQIPSWVSPVAEPELPAEVEQQLFTPRHGRCNLGKYYGGNTCEQAMRTPDGSTDQR